MRPSCENIGPAEVRKRLRIGMVSLAIGAVVGVALVALGAQRGWRLLALPPIWIGALCLVEAKARTCVMLGARGVRNMDGGDERITDPEERQALMKRSLSVHVWALMLTSTLTAALLAVP